MRKIYLHGELGERFGSEHEFDVQTAAEAVRALCVNFAWAIADFLEERGGDLDFYYTPPRESSPVKWTCEDWDDTVNDDGTRKITATFNQSFSNVM